MKKYNICLDVGGTKVLGVIFNEKREIIYRLKKRSKTGEASTKSVEDVIISIVEEMIKESGIKRLPMRNYNMRAVMEDKFGVPFFVGNDVNLGVLGEYKYGCGRGYKNIVGLFVGTGMGGGLILDGKMYTGNLFKGAELGHIILDPEGPLCNCGQRGCLEAFSSKTGMSNYIREQLARGRQSEMAVAVENGTFRSKRMKKALEAGDVVAMEAVDRACHYLAVATGNLINTFSPDLVVYGGGMIEACGDLFLGKILTELDRYCWPTIRDSVDVKIAALGDDSVLYGDLAMIEEG